MKKHILTLLILLIALPAMANHSYYCFGNGYVLQNVFNTLAMFYNIDGYSTLIKIVVIIGMSSALLTTMATKRLVFFTYLLTLFITASMFYWKKDTIIIEDLILDEAYIVDDVPYGYALLGELATTGGRFFTESFDTLFSVPNTILLYGNPITIDPGLGYVEGGYAAPFRALKEVQNVTIADLQQGPNFYDYIDKCLIWDIVGASEAERETFFNNPTIYENQKFPNGMISNLNLPVTIGGVDTYCTHYYQSELYTPIYNSITNLVNMRTSESKFAKMLSAQVSSASNFTSYSYTLQSLYFQNAIANGTLDAMGRTLSTGSFDEYTSFMASYGLEQSKVQSSVMSKIGMDVIPVFKNMMEVILIAFLPFVLIMMLAPGGLKIVKNYVMSLIWIQLFNPIMTVITFILNMSAVWKQVIYAQESGVTGMSIAALGNIAQFTDTYTTLAGYLILSVPVLATTLLHGGQWASSQLMGGIMGAASGTAGLATSPGGLQSALNAAKIAENGTTGMDIAKAADGNAQYASTHFYTDGKTGNMQNDLFKNGDMGMSDFTSGSANAKIKQSMSSIGSYGSGTYNKMRNTFSTLASKYSSMANTQGLSSQQQEGYKNMSAAANQLAGMTDNQLAQTLSSFQAASSGVGAGAQSSVDDALGKIGASSASGVDNALFASDKAEAERIVLANMGYNGRDAGTVTGESNANALTKQAAFNNVVNPTIMKTSGTMEGLNTQAEVDMVKTVFNGDMEKYKNFLTQSKSSATAALNGQTSALLSMFGNDYGRIQKYNAAKTFFETATQQGKMDIFKNGDGSMNIGKIHQYSETMAGMSYADVKGFLNAFEGNANAGFASLAKQAERKYEIGAQVEAFKNRNGINAETEAGVRAQQAAYEFADATSDVNAENAVFGDWKKAATADTVVNTAGRFADLYKSDWISKYGARGVGYNYSLTDQIGFRQTRIMNNFLNKGNMAEAIAYTDIASISNNFNKQYGLGLAYSHVDSPFGLSVAERGSEGTGVLIQTALKPYVGDIGAKYLSDTFVGTGTQYIHKTLDTIKNFEFGDINFNGESTSRLNAYKKGRGK